MMPNQAKAPAMSRVAAAGLTRPSIRWVRKDRENEGLGNQEEDPVEVAANPGRPHEERGRQGVAGPGPIALEAGGIPNPTSRLVIRIMPLMLSIISPKNALTS